MSPSYTGILQRFLSAWPELTRVNGWDCFCGQRGEGKKKVWKVLAEALRPTVRYTNWFCCLRWKTEQLVCLNHGCSCRLTVEGAQTDAGGQAEGWRGGRVCLVARTVRIWGRGCSLGLGWDRGEALSLELRKARIGFVGEGLILSMNPNSTQVSQV